MNIHNFHPCVYASLLNKVSSNVFIPLVDYYYYYYRYHAPENNLESRGSNDIASSFLFKDKKKINK